LQLENITIDCNSMAEKGIHTFKSHGAVTRIVNVRVTKATLVGFHFEFSMTWYGECLTASVNRGDGFWIEDANALTLVHTAAIGNGGIGIKVFKNDSTGGCRLIGGNVEGNGSHSLVASTSSTCVIEKFWIENGGDGVRLDGANFATVRDCRISGRTDGTNRAIRLTNFSRNCRIRDNDVALGPPVPGTPLDPDYATVQVESGSELNDATGNRRLSNNVTTQLPITYTDRTNTAQRVQADGSGPPMDGAWQQGDIVWNEDPLPGGEIGWVCVAEGTPGVWHSFGVIQP
jgi:hypothetical protein